MKKEDGDHKEKVVEQDHLKFEVNNEDKQLGG